MVSPLAEADAQSPQAPCTAITLLIRITSNGATPPIAPFRTGKRALPRGRRTSRWGNPPMFRFATERMLGDRIPPPDLGDERRKQSRDEAEAAPEIQHPLIAAAGPPPRRATLHRRAACGRYSGDWSARPSKYSRQIAGHLNVLAAGRWDERCRICRNGKAGGSMRRWVRALCPQ